LDLIRIKMLAHYLYRHLSTEFNKKKDLNNENFSKLIHLSLLHIKGFTKTKSSRNLLFEQKIKEIFDDISKGLVTSLVGNNEGCDDKKFGIDSALNLLERLLKKYFLIC
jgi:hypothetical protein